MKIALAYVLNYGLCPNMVYPWTCKFNPNCKWDNSDPMLPKIRHSGEPVELVSKIYDI